MSEKWLPIVGFAGYDVSSTGRVRSYHQRGDKPPRILRASLVTSRNRTGYYTVVLYRDGVRFHRDVHVLVAEAHIGPRPDGMFVLHRDDVGIHNSASNLYYDDRSENAYDSVCKGTHFNARKVKCRRGHDYDRENTYNVKTGGRMRRACRECERYSRAARKVSAA